MGRMCNRDRNSWPCIAAAVLAAGISFACATPAPPPVSVPTDAERRAAAAEGFELPEVASARALLPPDLLAGLEARLA